VRHTVHSRLVALLVALATVVAVGCGGGSDSETSTSGKPFQPQAQLRAVGGTSRTAKPSFVFQVTTRPGDANIRSVAVNLPPVVLIDATSIGGICDQEHLDKSRCAGYKPLGFAQVRSPAYQGTLSGPVYTVWGSGGGQLPDLAYVLDGPAQILLEGKVVSKGGRIQAGVEDVPDTPVKSFTLKISGGRRGYLVLSRDLCSGSPEADATFTSHGGQSLEETVPLQADC
jgi:hypothetical protein